MVQPCTNHSLICSNVSLVDRTQLLLSYIIVNMALSTGADRATALLKQMSGFGFTCGLTNYCTRVEQPLKLDTFHFRMNLNHCKFIPCSFLTVKEDR